MMVRGLGVDMVEIARLRAALARQPRLAARLFTPAERAYCESHADPAPHFAARFAAKEAVAKAVGRHLRWQEVEVVTEPSGRPSLSFTGESAAVTRGASFLVSLSHSRDYAVAAVVMLAPSPGLPEDEARTVIV
jgi:holo-[acyl-carrier protein] synthase